MAKNKKFKVIINGLDFEHYDAGFHSVAGNAFEAFHKEMPMFNVQVVVIDEAGKTVVSNVKFKPDFETMEIVTVRG